MKAILIVEYEDKMKELVQILAESGYEVNVKKTGDYWEHKYQVEVSKDESNTCN